MPLIPTMTKLNPKTNYTYAVGRRKSCVATIKLYSGKATSMVNGTELDKYFPSAKSQVLAAKPFIVTETVGKFHYSAKIVGGGKVGQLAALTLTIARALKKLDEAVYKSPLRNAGLLTVDSRVRERRMVGTGGKARRQKQSPKR